MRKEKSVKVTVNPTVLKLEEEPRFWSAIDNFLEAIVRSHIKKVYAARSPDHAMPTGETTPECKFDE